jgi:hypothetical protein
VGLWGSFCGCALGSFLYSSFFSFSFFNKTHYYVSKKIKNYVQCCRVKAKNLAEAVNMVC